MYVSGPYVDQPQSPLGGVGGGSGLGRGLAGGRDRNRRRSGVTFGGGRRDLRSGGLAADAFLGALLRDLLHRFLGGFLLALALAGGVLGARDDFGLRVDLDLLGEEELARLDEVEHGLGAGRPAELGDDGLNVVDGEVFELERLERALGVLADVTGDHRGFVTAVIFDLAIDEVDRSVGLLDTGDHAGQNVGNFD